MRKKRLNRRGHEIIKTQKAMTIFTLKPNSLIKRSLAGVDFFSLTCLCVCVCDTKSSVQFDEVYFCNVCFVGILITSSATTGGMLVISPSSKQI